MGIFKSATETHFSKEMEFKLYEKVVKDLAEGNKDLGVWGKAFVDADADEQKAKSLYIKLMVQRFKDQAEAEAEADLEKANEAEAEVSRKIQQKDEETGIELMVNIGIFFFIVIGLISLLFAFNF